MLVFFGGGLVSRGISCRVLFVLGGGLSLMAGVSPEAHPLGPVLVALWSPRSTSCQSTAGCWVQLSASGTCCTGLVHSRGILVYILPHFLLYFLSVFYYKSGPCYAQSIFEVPYTWWKNKWQIQCKHTMKAFLLRHLPEYQGDLDDSNCCMPVKANTLRIPQSPFPWSCCTKLPGSCSIFVTVALPLDYHFCNVKVQEFKLEL